MIETETAGMIREAAESARRGDRRTARTILHELLTIEPGHPAALLWLAGIADTPAEGLVHLERLLAIDPANARAREGATSLRLKIGVEAAQRKDRTEARRLLEAVLELDPKNVSALLWLAQVATDPVEALARLKRVVEIDPANVKAREGLAHFEKTTPKPAAAPPCPICQRPAGVLDGRCRACRNLVDFRDPGRFWDDSSGDPTCLHWAESRYEASARKGADAASSYRLALVYANLRRFDEARDRLREASSLAPSHAVLRQSLDALSARLAKGEVPAGRPARKKIMVVDDSPTVRKLVAVTLERAGYQVVEAGNGSAAVGLVQDSVFPDLVFLDITMPEMDGYKVCKFMRGTAEMRDTPIVMLSGNDGFFSKVRGKLAGSTQYMTKPFKPDELTAAALKYIGTPALEVAS